MAVLFSTGYLVVYAMALRAVERSWIAEADHTVQAGAAQIGGKMADVAEELQELASAYGRAPSADGAAWAALLDRARAREAGLVAAILLLEREGRVLACTPERWPRVPSVVRDAAIHRCAASGSFRVGGPVYGGDGFRYVVLAAPAGTAGTAGNGAPLVLAAVIDLHALGRRFLDTLTMPREATAFLATGQGRLISVSGEVQGSFPATVDALVPGEGLARLRALMLAGGSPDTGTRVRREGAAGTFFLRSAWTRMAGSPWLVGLLWPTDQPGGGTRLLLLATGLLFLLPLAAAVGLGAAWKRQSRTSAAAEREVTHWRQVAEESQRLTRWQVLGEASREPIVFLGGLDVESANERAADALGFTRAEELEGRSILELLAPEDRPTAQRWLAHRETGGTDPGTFRAQLLTRTGEHRQVELAVSALTVQGRELTRVTWRDLTARERAEAVLRVVAGAVPLGLALLDPSGTVMWSNDAFSRRLRGVSGGGAEGPPLAAVAPGDRRRARALFARAARGRAGEEVLRAVPGSGQALAAVCAAPVVVGGELFGVVLVARDADAEGAAGSAARPEPGPYSGLGQSLTHRLNNDLQALVGLVQRTGGGADGEHRLGQMAALVEDATRQLRHLTIVCRTDPVTLRRLRLGAAAERWAAAASAGLPAAVRVTVRRQTLDDLVLVDAGQLELFLDLAVAGSTSVLLGGGVIEVAVERAQQPGFVRLAVADTGPPASAATEELTGEAASVFRSQDLAREVLRALAARVGGRADAKSTTGIGNRLWCDLPLQQGRGEGSGAAAPPGGAILVADDEDLVRMALAAALREAGFEVLEAADGAEVLRLVERDPGRLALVVLDLVMPVLDGRETLERLRRAWPGLQVLLCTGYDPAGDAVLRGTEAIVKPFGIPEFLGRVRAMLSGTPGDGGDGGRMTA